MKTAWILTLGILLATPVPAQPVLTQPVPAPEGAAPIAAHAPRIAAAHASPRLGEPIEVLRWLDAVPPSARAGWGWRWLAAQLDQGVALHILDAETGTPLLRLRPHADTLWSLGWSHDGSTLATASWDGTVAVLSTD